MDYRKYYKYLAISKKLYTNSSFGASKNNYLQELVVELNKYANYYNQKNPKQPINFIQIDNIKFFKRQEIKDVLAVMKYLVNPNDYFSLQRILVNLIPNIGVRTVKQSSKKYLQCGLSYQDFINANFEQENYEPFTDLISAYHAKEIVVLILKVRELMFFG